MHSAPKDPKLNTNDRPEGKAFCLSDFFSVLLDLNPIELAIAKLKTLLRKPAAHTSVELWKAVGHAYDHFNEDECFDYSKATGCELDWA